MDLRAILSGKQWTLHRPNGDIRSPSVRFESGGEIVGYTHINETRWDLEDGKLVFRHADGHVTARAGDVTTEDGRYTIFMMCGEDASARAHFLVERQAPIADFVACRSLSEILDLARTHRAFGGNGKLGMPGFTPPVIDTLEIIEVSAATLPRLADVGVRVAGSFGARNAIIVDRAMPRIVNLTITFNGHGYNTVLLDKACRIRGSLNFEGSENLVIAGVTCPARDIRLTANFRYNAAGLLFGRGGSAGEINLWIEGPERSVQIGDDFMFSWGIWLRTADSHGMIDLESGAIANPSRSIVIGPHVWLGQDVIVMPGGMVGGGSVVGARAIVTKPVPENCVAVGSPAHSVRERTSWTRNAHPTDEEIRELQNWARNSRAT